MSDSEYRVKISIRNNLILSAIEAAGYATVAEFCRVAGMNKDYVNKFIRFVVSPLDANGEFRPAAKQLMEVLGAAPSDLWTDEQLQLKLYANSGERCISQIEINRLLAIGSNERLAVANPEDLYLCNEQSAIISEALEILTPIQSEILDLRFGLSSGKAISLDEIGGILGLSRERVRQIEMKALSRLRRPGFADNRLRAVSDLGQ
jgi:RNA polymerase sigma factor (sigma-70 family)